MFDVEGFTIKDHHSEYKGKTIYRPREIIKAALNDRKMSQAALARRLGIPRNYIYVMLGKNVHADKDMRVAHFAHVLHEIGFLLVAIPVDFQNGDAMFYVDWREKKPAANKPKKSKKSASSEGKNSFVK